VCCSVLQCVAACCSVLQCVATTQKGDTTWYLVCCSEFRMLYVHTTLLSLDLRCGAVWCRVLQCVAVCCNDTERRHHVVFTYVLTCICTHVTSRDIYIRTYARVRMHTYVRNIRTPHLTTRRYTHCDTLQHTATQCNTLQHTTTRCSTTFHNTQVFSLIPELLRRANSSRAACRVAVCCSVLQCVAV